MQKTKVYEGRFTGSNQIDSNDVFFDIAKSLMKAFQLEVDDKDNSVYDMDYLVNGKDRVIAIILNRDKQVLQMRMINCEKICIETSTEKEIMVKEPDIDLATWNNIIENDKRLQNVTEKMIRTFRYWMKITVMEDTAECWKYAEIARELLSSIQ